MKIANLKVKLTTGSPVDAVGLLKNFEVKVLDHYVHQTFILMDIKSSYKMILRQPFMRESYMVHDEEQWRCGSMRSVRAPSKSKEGDRARETHTTLGVPYTTCVRIMSTISTKNYSV